MSADVVVVGGGISGAAAAYRLSRDGVGVTLVDAAHEGQATAAGAGIISHAALRPLPDHWMRLFRESTRYYGSLVSHLAEDGEPDVGYAVVGEIIIAPGEDGPDRLVEIASTLSRENDRWPDLPVGEIDMLSPAEARRLFPPLADGLGAVHTSKVGRVDGRLLRDALHRAVTRRRGRVVTGTVRLEDRGGASAPAVHVAGERIEVDAVIVAAGAWTPELLVPLGVDLPVAPQRGQIVHVAVPAADTSSYPVVSGHGAGYMVAFPTGRVVLGATREDGAGFDYRVTAGGVGDILNRALEVAPGLGGATLQEIRVGFRPASSDGMPILGPVPGFTGLFVATGFGPSGLTLGPYSADLVAATATGARPSTPGDVAADVLAPFSPSRFGAGGRR